MSTETIAGMVRAAHVQFEDIGFKKGQIATAIALGQLVRLWIVRGESQCADELQTFINRIADDTSRT